MGFGFDLISAVFPVLFLVVFCIVIGTFISIAVRSAKENHRNNESPRLTVEARVVTKRAEMHRNMSQNNMMHTTTRYYATFEVPSGDRMEFSLAGAEYGMLVEGDTGKLTFQGTRYLSFERVL